VSVRAREPGGRARLKAGVHRHCRGVPGRQAAQALTDEPELVHVGVAREQRRARVHLHQHAACAAVPRPLGSSRQTRGLTRVHADAMDLWAKPADSSQVCRSLWLRETPGRSAPSAQMSTPGP